MPLRLFFLLMGIVLGGILGPLCPPGFAQEYLSPNGNQLGVPMMEPMQTRSVPDYSAFSLSPAAPLAAARPASWPTDSPAAAGSQPTGLTAPGAATPPRISGLNPAAPYQIESHWEFCEGTQILAQVGSEAIFAYEIMGDVNKALEELKDKIPDWQQEQARKQLIQRSLKYKIETKLVLLDAKRNIPAEGIKQTEKKIDQFFDEVQLPKLKKDAGVVSAKELDDQLRAYGGSLDRVRKAFIEIQLAQIWAREKFKEKEEEEVTYDQMLEYYREHLADFEKPARARWEEIVVRFSKFPDKLAAHDALVALGNQILSGAPFDQVAKAGSDGLTAAEGGARDWVTQGSLVDENLGRAVFGLPVGQLSPILENESGYTIIRVTERIEKKTTPFETAQVEISQKIKDERLARQQKEYLEELKRLTPVWTIFDNPDGEQQISQRPLAPRR